MKARNELKQIEKAVVGTMGNEKVTVGEVYEVNCVIIDEYLQVLEIIVNKIWRLKDHWRICFGTYEYYVSNFKRRYAGSLRQYNKYKLTETEYELLLKVFKEISE